MNTKANLKAALDSLHVNRPLRLPSQAPVFKAPLDQTPVENPTLVENQTGVEKEAVVEKETQVGNPTQVPDLTQVQSTTQVALSTPVQVPTQVTNSTGVQSSTLVPNQTPVQNPTQVGNSTEVTAPVITRSVTEQDSSVVLESQAVEKLSRGYTRVPNEVLMRLISQDFTRNEIKLALLVARFTISFQRKKAPLSKNVIERRTGLRGPAVLDALAGLVAKGLVEKEQGDQNRPNMLGLVMPLDWENPKKGESGGGTQVGKPTPVENPTQVGNPSSPEVENQTPAGVENPTYFKSLKTIEQNNSLSALPEKLREHLEAITAPRKRESEWKALQELKASHSLEDIADCVAHLQTRGIGSGDSVQPCHSPLAFLSKAIDGILPIVNETRRKAHERVDRERRQADAQRQRLDEEAREAAEWAKKERAFTEAFPSEAEQREVLANMLAGLPFSPDSQPGRIMGIGRWLRRNKS